MKRATTFGGAVACTCIVTLAVGYSSALQYTLKEKPLTNITTSQQGLQVVSPEVYEKIGEQSRAINDDDRRFNALDVRLNGIDASLGKLADRVKPIEETNLKVNWIIGGVEGLFGLLLTTGLLTWAVDALKRKREQKRESKA